jgi:hypothetical protein
VGCTREKISRRIREPGRQWKVRARIEGTSTSGWVKEKRGGWIESQAGERRLGRDHRVPSNSGVGKREEKSRWSYGSGSECMSAVLLGMPGSQSTGELK